MVDANYFCQFPSYFRGNCAPFIVYGGAPTNLSTSESFDNSTEELITTRYSISRFHSAPFALHGLVAVVDGD